MPKKSTKKEPDSTSIKESEKIHAKHESLEEKIIENLIILQKVHTDLAEKFNKLSEQITSLLNLFEMSARSFAQNPANLATEKDREFLEKIDKLLEQNKTIAKGLTLMEERIRDRVYPGAPMKAMSENREEYSPEERPLPKF